MALAVQAGLLARAGGGHGFSGGSGGGLGGGGLGSGGLGGGGLGGGGFGGGGLGGGTSLHGAGLGLFSGLLFGGGGFVVFLIVVMLVLSAARRRSGGGGGLFGRSGGLGGFGGLGGGGLGGMGSGPPPPPGGAWGTQESAAGAQGAMWGTGAGTQGAAWAPGGGNEGQPAISSVRGDVFAGTSSSATATSVAPRGGLEAITAHDPAFDQEAFLTQVQRAFFVVQEAWSERKPDLSRRVMADGLWQQHRVQIEGYVNAHKRNVLEDLSVGDLQVLSAHSDSAYDTIVVRVLASCADYDVDDRNGKVVRGDRRVESWQEDWTFQRSSKASTNLAGGTLSAKCPNCGAPLDLDLAGVCRYCKAPVMSGDYDWVLARIAQVSF